MDDKKLNLPDCCVACTACITVCPVTAVTHKFRGPKLVGPAHSRLKFAENDIESSLEYCSNCKNCDIACPSSVPVSTLNMLARAKYYETHSHTQRDEMMGHPEKVAKMVSKLPFGAFFANGGMAIGRSLGIIKSMGMADQRPLPEYSSETFMSMFKRKKQPVLDKKIVFFPGCVINYNEPEIGLDLVDVMNKNGYKVLVDENFVCCGSPLVTTGFLREAKDNAQKNTSLIKQWSDMGYSILTLCTSCSLMLKQEYQELFEGEISDVEENAKHIFDACEFLEALYQEDRLNKEFGEVKHQYMYHAPCHLRVQGIGLPAMELLRLVPGVKVTDADAGCCGISGNYGYKAENYDRSMKVGQTLFDTVKDSSADTVLTDCGTCRSQIAHGANVKTMHPISILAEAYHNAD